MSIVKFWMHGFAFGNGLGLLSLLLILPTDPHGPGRQMLAIVGAGTVVVFVFGTLFAMAAIWVVSKRARGVQGKGMREME
jgi:hypothetical protein